MTSSRQPGSHQSLEVYSGRADGDDPQRAGRGPAVRAGHSASRLWSWEETLTHPIPAQCCPPVAPRQKPGCQKIQRTPAEVSPWGNQVWGGRRVENFQRPREPACK